MNETRKQIGAQLRRLRRQQGMTLDVLAPVVGMDRSYLGKIETGRINVSIDKLDKVVAGLGLDLFEFFDTFERP